MAHHRVELVQGGDDVLDLLDGLALRLGEKRDFGLGVGHELVQRGIEEADGYRHAFESFVQLLKVALLIRQDLRKSGLALFDGVGADHLAERGDTVGFEEHVLGAAEADALGAQLAGLLRVARGVGVGADTQAAVLVGPAHDAAKVAGNGGVNGRDDAVVDLAGGAVDGDEIAFVERLAAEGELLVRLVHGDVAAAGDAAGAHAAGNDRRVGGHAAADGEDALGGLHAGDVLGRGLKTDENDLLAALLPLDGVVGVEDDLAAGSARAGAEALAHRVRLGERFGVELRVEQGVKVARVDHQNGLLLIDHAFIDEVARDLERGLRGALAVAGLEHEELAVLNGELHVLHIVIVVLQRGADLHELVERFGELLFHLGDGHRGADAGDDVFALRVGEELTHELLLAGGGVTREGDAGAGVVVQVAEYHRHDVDGSAPGVRDVVVAAVNVRARVVPGAEHGLDRFVQLGLRVGREVLADLLLVLGLELLGELLEVGGGQFDVELDALLGLHLVDELLKVLLADFHDDVGEHLDEAAVGVVNKALKLGIRVALDHGVDDLVVQAEVQNGVHHAGHGSAGAGTDGNEHRVLEIAELLAVDLFHLGDVFHDLRHDLVVDLAAVLIVLGARLGGNREALRNRETDVGHFGKVRAFAAEKLAHGSVALAEQVNVLVAHGITSCI